jgi:hypothetical protein
MKTMLMILGMLLMAVPFNAAVGQSESEALVTATVEQSLALLTSDGDWGLFASGNIYVVTPAGYKDPPGPGEGPGVVVAPVAFEINGDAGSGVQVNLVLPSSFVSDDQSGELPLSNWHYAWNYDDDPTASFNGAGALSGGAISLNIGGDAVSGLFLGATVSVPNEAFPGLYTAQIIASVAYLGN